MLDHMEGTFSDFPLAPVAGITAMEEILAQDAQNHLNKLDD